MRLKKKAPDFMIFLTVLILLSIGIIMVFSSSQYAALHSKLTNYDSFYYLKKQSVWALLGIGTMIFVMKINYQKLKVLAKPALIVSFIMLFLVLIVGITHKGSSRWLGVGSLQFQPSEVIKLTMVMYMALSLSRSQHVIKSFTKGVLPHLAILGGACVLILMQPDLGTAVALAGTTYVMLWSAGARKTHMGLLFAAGVGLIVAAIVMAPYRMERFLAFLDPWKDPQDTGFQTIQSLLATGSGDLFGIGLGASRAKLLYLPERHTDFIFSILAEELGFMGGTLVIFLFLFFVWRGLKVAVTSTESFGSLLAVGVTSMIGLQAIINLGVVTGSMPVTGITLPFISYGGSSLVFTLAGVGLLLNVSRYVGINR